MFDIYIFDFLNFVFAFLKFSTIWPCPGSVFSLYFRLYITITHVFRAGRPPNHAPRAWGRVWGAGGLVRWPQAGSRFQKPDICVRDRFFSFWPYAPAPRAKHMAIWIFFTLRHAWSLLLRVPAKFQANPPNSTKCALRTALLARLATLVTEGRKQVLCCGQSDLVIECYHII